MKTKKGGGRVILQNRKMNILLRFIACSKILENSTSNFNEDV
jgi:hypothetical protein